MIILMVGDQKGDWTNDKRPEYPEIGKNKGNENDGHLFYYFLFYSYVFMSIYLSIYM